MTWTTPNDLTRQVRRLWERGILLRSLLSDDPLFPKRLVLKGPSSADLAHAFGEVRDWCAALAGAKHLRLVERVVRHQVSGTNRLPAEAWIDSAADAVALIGKTQEWRQFEALVETTRRRRRELLDWIAHRPLVALEHRANWSAYLDLIDWLRTHPRPGCYLRQVDLPGIHTKFIEAHRGLLAELFDRTLHPDHIDGRFTGTLGFCRRYGFREKPERIRFRVLDPKTDPVASARCTDISLDIPTAARLENLPTTLFITENETNFLAFPRIADSWILFGAGYGFSSWAEILWMRKCRILYWGDIDTHGFAVLNELRHTFPHAESFLMDRETLDAHRSFWDTEPKPALQTLPRLRPEEASLYHDLQANRIRPNLRLEQERIGFSALLAALSKLGFKPWV